VSPRTLKVLLLPAALGACLLGASAAGGKTQAGDCTPGADWGQARQSLAPAVLTLVNQHRATLGLAALRSSPTLTAAAVWKARHMAKYGYFGHDDPAPPVARSAFARISACGYHGQQAGENIAAGFRTPASVMQAWLASPGHRANIEGAAWRALGIGVAQSGTGTVFWVQDFGSTDDSGTPLNRRPSAQADRRSVRRHRRLVVRVLRNDRDPDRDALRIVRLLKLPRHGRAWVTGDAARVVYRPAANFAGRDRFRYEVSDGKGGYASAPVILRVKR
jgi:uncharacterized protein YkwD